MAGTAAAPNRKAVKSETLKASDPKVGGFFSMDKQEYNDLKDFMPDGPCRNFDTCTCGDCKDCERYEPIETLDNIFKNRIY